MIVNFRDELGSFSIENVADIRQIDFDLWDVMTTDYESQEVKAEFVNATMEGF